MTILPLMKTYFGFILMMKLNSAKHVWSKTFMADPSDTLQKVGSSTLCF